MIDDRIGTIGSTHGVNDRPRPSSANSGRITSSLPLFKAASRRPESSAAGAGAAATGGGGGVVSVAVGVGTV
jgi:hypothetical protein